MALGEFDLIRRYFAVRPLRRAENQLGIGDDCALMTVPHGQQLAITTDTMVENVHFFADVDPEALGHKLLAVNLSDLAAMGAEPLAVTLALTLPKIDEDWLQAFARGFLTLAERFNVDLIGGDTTAGPLTLSVQAMGLVPNGKALKRSGAQVGDRIYVSGPLGDAGLALKMRLGQWPLASKLPLLRLERPMPQVELGVALRDIATACIDISDGLASDLGHILRLSGVGAVVNWQALPLSDELVDYIQTSQDWRMPLIAGDDYQLCFTVPANFAGSLPDASRCIGFIEAEAGLRVDYQGRALQFEAKGYEHFS